MRQIGIPSTHLTIASEVNFFSNVKIHLSLVFATKLLFFISNFR